MPDLFVFRRQKCSIGKLIFMLAVNIEFCIANFSTGIPFKILFVIKKVVVFVFIFIKT